MHRQSLYHEICSLLTPYVIQPITFIIVDFCFVNCLFVKIDGSRVYDSRCLQHLQLFQNSFNFSMFGNLFQQNSPKADEVDVSEWCVHVVDSDRNRDKSGKKQIQQV